MEGSCVGWKKVESCTGVAMGQLGVVRDTSDWDCVRVSSVNAAAKEYFSQVIENPANTEITT